MIQLLGFKAAAKEKLVCKLEKPLYELKQSYRQWYMRFDKFIMGHGYTINLFDPCFYFRKLSSGKDIYLLLYVNDM